MTRLTTPLIPRTCSTSGVPSGITSRLPRSEAGAPITGTMLVSSAIPATSDASKRRLGNIDHRCIRETPECLKTCANRDYAVGAKKPGHRPFRAILATVLLSRQHHRQTTRHSPSRIQEPSPEPPRTGGSCWVSKRNWPHANGLTSGSMWSTTSPP